MTELRLVANCVVGLGFSRRGFAIGLERAPDLIGGDAGSTDYGAGFLGSGRDPLGIAPQDWSVRLRPYGYHAVLGALEPERPAVAHEVGLVVDVVAATEDTAVAIAARSAATGSRLDITGRLGGGGNFAYPFSPNVLRGGEVYECSVWHLMEVADEVSAFRTELVQL